MRFDVCLGKEAAQDEVMHGLGIYQLMNAAMAGYSVCVLAYGPTGSGKTHTMTGSAV